MATIVLPSTDGQPTDGSYTYTVNGVTYSWDGDKWNATVTTTLNTEYVSLTGGDITGNLNVSGSIGIGTIIHSGDTDTAIRFPADDTFTIETAGSERLRISSSGVTQFTPSGGVTVSVPSSGSTTLAGLDLTQTYTKAQRGDVVTLTDGATIASDFASANNFFVTLGGNRTFDNPSNLAEGQSGVIMIRQDGTGSRTLSWGSYWKFPGGIDPTLTTTANAYDALSYFVYSTDFIVATLLRDVR